MQPQGFPELDLLLRRVRPQPRRLEPRQGVSADLFPARVLHQDHGGSDRIGGYSSICQQNREEQAWKSRVRLSRIKHK